MAGVAGMSVLAAMGLWIPAFAGMTVGAGMVGGAGMAALAAMGLWVPAFAGMTVGMAGMVGALGWRYWRQRGCGFLLSRE